MIVSFRINFLAVCNTSDKKVSNKSKSKIKRVSFESNTAFGRLDDFVANDPIKSA